MVKVERDGDFLNYSRDGHIFYDPAIPSPADAARFFRHLMDKNWMTQELKAETACLVLEYLGDET